VSLARVVVFAVTELAAAGTAAAIQANSGATIERQISVAIGVATLIGIVWAVVRFFLRPLIHNWLFAVLSHEQDRTAGTVVKALDHDDDTRAITRRFIDRLYHDKIANDQETRDIAEQNRDEIGFLKESNARQGEALTREIGRAMEHIARSTDQQTRIMEQIKKEIEDHSIIIARMDERISNWDGHERRTKPR
jgi:hypothetical protein